MFLLASSCRLVAKIETGDRMIKQVKVRPLDTKQQATNTRRQASIKADDVDGAWTNEDSFTEDTTPLDTLKTKIERKDWAKTVDSQKNRKVIPSRVAKSKNKARR